MPGAEDCREGAKKLLSPLRATKGCRAIWDTVDVDGVNDLSAWLFIAPLSESPFDPQHSLHPGQMNHSYAPRKLIQQDVERQPLDLQYIVTAAAGEFARPHEKGVPQCFR